MKPSDFYTVPKSEAGVKVPLLRADDNDSGQWIQVMGQDAKPFKRALRALNQALSNAQEIPDLDERATREDEARLDFLSAITAAWSFDEPFSLAAAREFLANAPAIADGIDKACMERQRFFGPASESSTGGSLSSDASGADRAHSSSSDSVSA